MLMFLYLSITADDISVTSKSFWANMNPPNFQMVIPKFNLFPAFATDGFVKEIVAIIQNYLLP